VASTRGFRARRRHRGVAGCLAVLGMTLGAGAQTLPAPAATEEAETLPEYLISSPRVANQAPVGTAAMPVSVLRYEPRVDIQGRNQAEQQADVSLRGGIFESTGFKVGAVSLYDPQTGHYFAELPVAPAMLAPPEILTGARNSLEGFNAGVGTIAYGWRAIRDRGELALGFGDHGFNQQSFYAGKVWPGRTGGTAVAADVELARSESDGSRPFGEHDFLRLAGRVQLQGARSQTDLFAGYQAKFFGWPNLYTPFGFNETENLQTVLVAANHRAAYGTGSWWQLGGYYRRNKDDYEFNRAVPGASNPFQHTTHVRGAGLDGRHEFAGAALGYRAAGMTDRLQSTALTFGRFRTRDYLRLALVPEISREVPSGKFTLQAGAAYDDTNRDESALSPVLSVSLLRAGAAGPARLYLEYAENSQVATYTALNSNAAAGLFRGNPNLGRETTRNLELGARVERAGWRLEAAAFHRREDELVDWTFRNGVVARTANPVDIGVTGLEVLAARHTARFDLILGYTFLDKDSDYRAALVDASFYALNFAKHRLTAALTWRLGRGWEIRADNELRIQERNPLRVNGGEEAILSTLGVHYRPPGLSSLELSLQLDNLWDDDFEEVPSVPAGRRQFSGGVAWRW